MTTFPPSGRFGGPVLLTARWVIGHRDGRHVIFDDGVAVFEGDKVVFVGHDYAGEVAERIDYGNAIISPGFVDLDALSDLDTTVLAFDNQPSWKKGRVWPKSYMDRGPYEMYSQEELAFQKRYAFAQLIRNGVTTALPIASLFYREWGETDAEFSAAADVAHELGLRVYLGPAYRAGNSYVDENGRIAFHFDEERGLRNFADSLAFAERIEGLGSPIVRAMLAPDRIETGTPELMRRTAAAGRDLDIPIRQHCCQSELEFDRITSAYGMTPLEWLDSIGALSDRMLLPHGELVAGTRNVERAGRDLDILRNAGATLVHCPIVSARHAGFMDSFSKFRAMGVRIGLGTDTWPCDFIQNMQVGVLLSRVMDGSIDSVRSEHYFDAGTLGGADALKRPDLGRLEPGAKADIIVIDMGHDRIGHVIDPIQTLMLSSSGRDVRTTIIDGRFVMVDGVIPGFDAKAEQERAQRQFDGLVARYPERTHGHPPVEEIFSSSYPRYRRDA
ncbi:amidohydrolase family protein [Shinella kummerowiae]|uniref:amidohydrolase family protein n=1 Tax=Shinella kummerowiae TaxID=417745 RepID=UPI0021B5F8C7|nr:amidohydrolase family protein [Shinella kummerowiae]MCT7663248.1 amidohydrolase family protein [Shinella kummerowiae]